jgi:cell wall-associated NlpC family hydrolase
MRNLKHTIISITAIVMVGTLSVFQVSELSAKKLERNMKLSTASKVENITIASTENESGTVATAFTSTEEEVVSVEEPEAVADEATEQAIAEKSYLTLGYAKVTGSANLRQAPSVEAEVIGSMMGADQVEILESTDGWYKVIVNGQSGYVKKELITLDKAVAQEAAMQYDHYKKATVKSDTGLRIRTAGREDAESIGTISNNENVIIVDKQGDYLKILYGDDYKEGYVIKSGLETGEWIEKATVHSEIKRIAKEKEEAEKARQAAIAQEKARQEAAKKAVKTEKSSTKSNAGQTKSASGQALVNTVKKYLGVPYVWGGTSPRGFDCSGLMQYVCRQHGISIPRVAASQRNAGRYVSRENLLPGDLVFFAKGGRVNHVGMYIGNGNMIHAPQTGDVVKVSSINSSYRINHYAGAVRVW